MDKYKRVPRQKEESKIEENEIRVTTQGKPRNFISYATTQFTEKNATTIQLKAMGGAISKTVTIAEIIKRRIPGLHSLIVLESTDIIDYWEPLEEGLDRLETVRHVSSITITLSKNQLDANAPGYQAPLPADQVKEISTPPKKSIGRRSAEGSPQIEGSERRVGRGGRRPRPRMDREDFSDSTSPSEVPRRPVHGRGRGRGRGRRLPPVGGERGPRPPRQDFDEEGEIGTHHNNRGFSRGFSRGTRRPMGGRDVTGAPMQGGRGRGRGRRPGGRGRGRGRFPRDEQGAPARGGQYRGEQGGGQFRGEQESSYDD